MASPNPNPHANHRERMRSLFLESGLDGFSEHNILEMLLFYTIPKGDTNVTAHNLIDTFGSLHGVLEAPVSELVKVKGVGQYTATFLSMLPQLFRRYTNSKNTPTVSFSDTEGLFSELRARFLGETVECAYLLSFGSDGFKTNISRISLGSVSRLQLDRRVLLEAAFRSNAVYTVLAHNHPNGIAAPSTDDIAATRDIVNLFSGVNIRMTDHIIVAGSECFSMAANNRFKMIFI